jgi:arylsulfatase A-like enzyme
MLPHGPHIRDEKCEVVPKALRTDETLAARKRSQHFCAYDLVRRFLENLKLLGRYDDATIIIHSDHGEPTNRPEGAQPFDPDQSDKWPAWYVEDASSGLMMIKWPYAKDFSVSDLAVLSIDIAPTVLEQLEIPIPSAFEGLAIQTMPADLERENVFYGWDGVWADEFSKFVKTDAGWVFQEKVPITSRMRRRAGTEPVRESGQDGAQNAHPAGTGTPPGPTD